MTKPVQSSDYAVSEDASALPVPLHRTALKLQFNGALESEFQRYFSAKNLRNVRYLFLGGLALFSLYGILDYFLLGVSNSAWMIRYGIGTPIFIAFALTSFSKLIKHHQQALIFLGVSSYDLIIMAIVFYVPEEASQSYFASLLVAMMAGLTLVGMRFSYAVFSSVLIMLFYAFGVALFKHSGVHVVSDFALLASSSVVCCFGTYFSERSARNEFIQNRVIKLKQIQLEKVNAELKKLVDIDGLTGVANRRHFDERLEDEWRRARRAQYPVALLMIDIDFFKNYNDEYGHQKGDACLKAVAAALQLHAQRPGDLTARYGGEEFAIILPHVTLESAFALGQQICQGVAGEQIEHKASSIAPVVTVSVGATSMVPDADTLAVHLVETADQALYRSKQSGRNRCSSATFISSHSSQSTA